MKAGIRRAKKAKAKHKGPMIIGKAYASDKKGKGMHIPMASASQMKAIRSDIGRATKEFYEKARFKKFGYDKGGDVRCRFLGFISSVNTITLTPLHSRYRSAYILIFSQRWNPIFKIILNAFLK